MPQKTTKSKAQGFTHGMVSDADPRFQIKGSYSDGYNIRLANERGDTFTVENIEGNELLIDLFALSSQDKLNAYTNDETGMFGTRTDIPGLSTAPASTDIFSEIYWDPDNTDNSGNPVGSFYPSPVGSNPVANGDGVFPFHDKNGSSLEDKASIVGYTSFGNELILIIVAEFTYIKSSLMPIHGSDSRGPQNRTIFLRIIFDNDEVGKYMTVRKVEDLAVCYSWGDASYDNDHYPTLGMELDKPVRVEHLVENECISRIYWTDNKNPLRTLNLKQSGKNQLAPTSLDLTPLMDPSQPILSQNLHGSLPVGVYQYVYKYISSNGGESTYSPLSNVYHVSNQSFSSTQTYGGGPKGELGTQGFKIRIDDVDPDFEYIELYSLLYEDLNSAPRVSLVDRKTLTGATEVSFTHVSWSTEIENGLEQVLIESNTWDVCKDIAIKDNILFAANLKQKKNWISEKEWNVKILRYNIADGAYGAPADKQDGILTTNDSSVYHYEEDAGEPVTPKISGTSYPCTGHLANNLEHRPAWATLIDYQRHKVSGDLTGSVKNSAEYRFLRDGMTLGGESWDYENNGLGGCRVTFGIQEKVADITTNDGNKPYVSAINNGVEEFKTDDLAYNENGTAYPSYKVHDPVYRTTMSIAGSMDPHNAGDKRGYQRGEIYRFGVQVYDLNGAQGNVLWIGDIQMPEMYDVLRMIDKEKTEYHPFLPTTSASSDSLTSEEILTCHRFCQDHKLSHIYGHAFPPVDVNWFTGRTLNSSIKSYAYVGTDGKRVDDLHPTLDRHLNPVIFNTASGGKRAKWYPWWDYSTKKASGASYSSGHPAYHDDKHYLFDLYVNFEFIIPQNVAEKISGYRVVRAERTEQDRRIVQQGILNQTLKYGQSDDLQDGYDDNCKWSVKDNENLGDDPIFTNEYDDTTPTDTVQPEYDTYLNGYVGLAENNHLGFVADDDYGKLTDHSGYFAAAGTYTIYAFIENDIFRRSIPNIWPYRDATPASAFGGNYHPGPGSRGFKGAHSALFGSYEKCQSGSYYSGAGAGSSGNPRANANNQVPGNIFTFDSPDSAFGIRPYNFKEGDLLRIDSLMRLTDEKRYKNMLPPHQALASSYSSHASGVEAGLNPGLTPPWINDWSSSRYSSKNVFDRTESEALKFASKKQLDKEKDYGMLIGKYYIYDTYWGIGMETDGGRTYANGWDDVSFDPQDIADPKEHYRYFAEISAAKELGSGEIVPASFFEASWEMESEYIGFSNHTLGVVSDRSKWYAKWGGVSTIASSMTAPHLSQVGSSENTTEGDLNYNTMSTIQLGLRSILLETFGSGYNFHPRNLHEILSNQDWRSRDDSANPIVHGDKYYLGHAESLSPRYGWKSYIPYKYLCSIVRKTVPYGGYSKSAIQSTRYISCGNFHRMVDQPVKQGHVSQVFGGDTFVNLYSHQKTSTPYMRNSYARWQLFPVESFINTDMRSGLNLHSGDTEVGKNPTKPPFSNDWLYNEVYSQENTLKSGLMVDEDITCDALDLPFEIAYSNTKISGAPGDAFRVFPINQFHDMEGKYGEINRIINFKNDIYILQDEAFAKLLVNPISMITDETGQGLFTGTGDTVENHIYISAKFGSRHIWSVVTSEDALYFVDSKYARLFKYDTEKIISLGDTLGQRNRLKSLIKDAWDLDSIRKIDRDYGSDNPLRFCGINSIFDHTNKELMVTFHNGKIGDQSSGHYSSTLVFNEGVNAFTSSYSAKPSLWMLAESSIVSTGNQVSVEEYMDNPGTWGAARHGALKLWLWNNRLDKQKLMFWDSTTPSTAYIEKVINDAADSAKVFDNGQIIMGDSGSIEGALISFWTENTAMQSHQANLITTNKARYREGILRFPLRGIPPGKRMRGTWLKIKYTVSTSDKFNIFAILAKYRKSYN